MEGLKNIADFCHKISGIFEFVIDVKNELREMQECLSILKINWLELRKADDFAVKCKAGEKLDSI